MKSTLKNLGLVTTFLLSTSASANMIGFTDWTSNENGSPNYNLQIDDNTAGRFNINLTINPWNAEALGLFLDLGDVDINAALIDIMNVTTAPTAGGSVSLFASDTASDDCGGGCTLSGLNPPLLNPDGEWEMVFSLGTSGFEGIQTFSFSIFDYGLSLDNFGLAGIRSQQYCGERGTLDGNDGSSGCDGSDKSYSGYEPTAVPEPSNLALLGLGLFGLAFSRRKQH